MLLFLFLVWEWNILILTLRITYTKFPQLLICCLSVIKLHKYVEKHVIQWQPLALSIGFLAGVKVNNKCNYPISKPIYIYTHTLGVEAWVG
jgi:hypothetical protein